MSKPSRPTKERLLNSSEINASTGCRIWCKATCRDGYGKIKYHGKMEKAHRVSYQEFVGPIPDGHFVCHSCDVRRCIEPTHLFLGLPKDNTADMVKKGRHSAAGGGKPKLTIRQRLEVKRSIRNGESIHSLAFRFGISASSVRHTRDNDIRRVALQSQEAGNEG